MVVSKRLFIPALLLVVVLASSAYYLYKPAGEVAADITYSRVDMASFLWSGQSEGETVKVNPDFPQGVIGPYMPPFNRFSLARGIDEAVKRLGGRVPLLPTLVPEGMKYADVYIGPVVIVCYSYREAEDFRFTDMGVEISPAPLRVPTPEELRPYLQPDEKLIQIGPIWALLTDKAHDWDTGQLISSAYFIHDGLSYSLSVRHPLTSRELIKVIGSMKTPY